MNVPLRIHLGLYNDETGEVAAVTILVGIYFDTVARKAISMPADIRERASRMISAPARPS